MYRPALTLALLILTASARGADQPLRQWVVVSAPALRTALKPLYEWRRQQGFRVKVVETTDVLTEEEVRAGKAEKLCQELHKLCRDFPGTSSILLAGAVGEPGDDIDVVVPPLKGTVGRMKGEPSDYRFGCPRGDPVYSVPVGRFPARTTAEAAGMVQKTLDLERDERPGAWRRRLTVLAGPPAYSPLVDRLVESLALARLDRIDPAWTGRAIYHNPASRFCVPDGDLHARALGYVQEGQALTLYLGHSSPQGFCAGPARFLDRDDWKHLRIARGAGIFATFGCYGCQLRGRDGEGYGVAAVRNPHGPAAVLGSQGICYAAMVQLASEGLVGSLLSATPPERLGTAWRALVNGLANGNIDPVSYSLLNAVDGDGRVPQSQQRQEHVEMFVLLGDPALRLPRLPSDVSLKVAGQVRSGSTLEVDGTLPGRLSGSHVRITLERTPGTVPPGIAALPGERGAARDRTMRTNHDCANCFVLAEENVGACNDRFSATLEVPSELRGHELILRAYAASDRAEGQGLLRLPIDR